VITGVPGGPFFEVTQKNNTKKGVVTCGIHADLGGGAELRTVSRTAERHINTPPLPSLKAA
jgi:hypothetical protein